MSHDVDVLLSAAHSGREVTIPDGWGQGRATFGGLVGGALLARILGETGLPAASLRSVTINFVAPTLAGDATLTVEVLRQGSSATQVEARLLQSDGAGPATVCAVALATFGKPRASAVEVVAAGVTCATAFDEVEAIPYIKGLTPDFIGHVDLRVVTGGWPFSGSPAGDFTGYMRFREVTEQFGVAHLVTLIDGWPPAPALVLSQPAALSSMTWTLEFLAPVEDEPQTVWTYDVVTDAAHEGYGHTQARIATPDGQVVVISRQTVAIFG